MPKTETVQVRIRQMRDDLVELTSKHNEVGDYERASRVLSAVIVLDKLGDLSSYDSIAWPPQIDDSEGYKSLMWVPETEGES